MKSVLLGLLTLLTISAPAFADPVIVPPAIDTVRGCDKPHYPLVSRRLSEQGSVVLRFLVAPDGSVQKGMVTTSSGFERLDQAALDSLSQCRFNPATIDGQIDPEPAWALVRYVWKLEEGAGDVPPGDHSWYLLAGDKNAMFVADEYSASSKDGVISFIESEIFYTMTHMDKIDTPIRRFDSQQAIDCGKKLTRMTAIGLIDDNNHVIVSSPLPAEQPWVAIQPDSPAQAAADLFCDGHYNTLMVRKDKDIYQVQQVYLNAVKGLQ